MRPAFTLPRPATPLVRPGIPLDEYRGRRERLLAALNGAAAVVLAGEAQGHGPFRPDAHFLYLTGIATEPGAALLLSPAAEDPRRRVVLFLKPLNPEAERWDRYREPLTLDLRARAGFDSGALLRTDHLPTHLATAARRAKRLACLHPFAPHTAGVSPDLALYRKVAERIPGVAIEDRTTCIPEMRAVKSPAEIDLMRRAAAATAAGYAAAMTLLKPRVPEKAIERALFDAYTAHGAEAHAYDPIVGSGLNATVLHYRDNASPCEDGDLLLIDSGASVHGYACDVTRTWPVSGRFTPPQRRLYDLVLKAQAAAIKAARPGAFMWQVDKAARDVLESAGLGDAYIHSIGHHLGLEVHDATPDGPLKPGMVITVEPGVYLPAGSADDPRPVGIRIEDDLLITKTGNENLTAPIPKSPTDLERLLTGTPKLTRKR
jgi:Xaa-Pro aminopeptidase